MTSKQQQYKKSLIQKIQISKKDVFKDDEQRRDFMNSRFGVDSTTKLTIDELKSLLDFCQRKVSDVPFSKPSSAQIKKIYELWYENAREKSEEALDSFVFKIIKKHKIDITKIDATKIIIALQKLGGV
ncbi:MAG: hypothetical protein C0625_08045 [Arcobacter sp.]|nr:MAG: hypothetical protein C0625_08045 [Arcobacter sp.]